MPKKLTYSYVKEQINQTGYTLLSTTYINQSVKLKIQCDKNHVYKASFGHFKQGKRCPICANNIKYTYEYVKEYIESYGYALLSTEYVNARTKLKIQCDKGHVYYPIWTNFQKGHRCSVCSKNKKLSFNYVKKQVKLVDGYSLLGDIESFNKNKLKIKCDKGHVYETAWCNFNNKCKCPECYGGIGYTHEYIKEKIESVKNYKLLSKYNSAHDKLTVKCDKGHIYYPTWANFSLGHRCSVCCDNGTSKAEQEIQSYVKTIIPNVVCNDRTQVLNPDTKRYLELDIYLPDLNKAIEYNGTYWHSFPNAINKDTLKKRECCRLGIDLLVINEEDYISDRDTAFFTINEFIFN